MSHLIILGRDRLNRKLIHAANLNMIADIKLLLTKGADINAKDDKGWTALHYACRKGHIDVCKLLIDAGADYSITSSEFPIDPLSLCAGDSRNKLCIYITEKSIKDKKDLNSIYFGRITPLCWAAHISYLEICKKLVSNGADVNLRDKDGITPLNHAINAMYSWNNSDQIGIVDLLIKSGADLNAQNKEGNTPLSVAAISNSEDVTKLLLDSGTDVNRIFDSTAKTPLMIAAIKENENICELLVKRGANVNAKDNDGWTPLFFAAQNNNIAICQTLYDHGADVSYQNQDGLNVLDVCNPSTDKKYEKIHDFLVKIRLIKNIIRNSDCNNDEFSGYEWEY